MIGGLLFIMLDAHRGAGGDHRVVLDQARMAKLVADYRAEYAQDPSPVELRAMANRYVSDEIYYREGRALGIDRDDEIIRRRIVQKMQFISEDRYVQGNIPADQLQAYYRQHLIRYVTPTRVSFSHIFFGLQRGDAAAKARASAVLATLAAGAPTRAPERGDRFTDLYDYDRMDADGLRRLFGPSGVTAGLAAAPIGRWLGPYRSAYGWHLVYVSARTLASVQPFADVADRVRSDYVDDQQARANAQAYSVLRRRYKVVGDRAALAHPQAVDR